MSKWTPEQRRYLEAIRATDADRFITEARDLSAMIELFCTTEEEAERLAKRIGVYLPEQRFLEE